MISKKLRFTPLALGLAILLIVPSFAAAADLAKVQKLGDAMYFEPLADAADMVLTVTGPCDYYKRTTLSQAGELVFELDESTVDGTYRYELKTIPRIEKGLMDELRQARERGDMTKAGQACRAGHSPDRPQVQQAVFTVANGEIVFDPSAAEPAPQVEKAGGLSALAEGMAAAAGPESGQLGAAEKLTAFDNLYVYNSACIGFDCVNNGETFGSDTIRMKENNLRIHTEDTSGGSFPTTDWRIEFNSNLSGGGNWFRVQDATANRSIMTLEGNAPSHSLYVENSGDVGFGTANPVLDLHVATGDTPGLRLEQDTSSGFGAQTWDLAGNETSFFIRDATNGSTLPFRIRPSASSNALVIDTDSDIGMGTLSPSEELHVLKSDADDVFIRLENSNATTQNAGFTLVNSAATWNFFNAGNGRFRISGAPGTVLEIDDDTGDVTINNDLTVSGTCNGCDAVFQPEWPLESIEEHAEAMWSQSYLPAVGPTAEGETSIDVFQKVTGILQELEKAHIYIDQLHQRVAELETRLESDEE